MRLYSWDHDHHLEISTRCKFAAYNHLHFARARGPCAVARNVGYISHAEVV